MKRMKSSLGAFLIAAVLLAQPGCMLLTARRVAMAGGKFVGKKIYDKSKEDKTKNEQAKAEQAKNEQANSEQPRQEPSE